MKIEGEHREEELWRRFWNKQPDGMALNKEEMACYVLDFKRALEQRYRGAQEQERQRAQPQQDNLVSGLSEALAGCEWQVNSLCRANVRSVGGKNFPYEHGINWRD